MSDIENILTKAHGKDLTKEEIKTLADAMTGETLSQNLSTAKGQLEALFQEVFVDAIPNMQRYLAESESIRNSVQQTSVAYEKASEKLYDNLRANGKLNAAVNLYGGTLTAQRKRKQALVDLIDYEIKLIEDKLKQAVIENESTVELTAALEELILKKAEANDETEKATEQEDAYNNVQEKTKTVIESTTGVSNKWKKTLIGSMIASKDLSKSLMAVGAAAKKSLSPANVLGSTLMKIQEATIAMALAEDDATVSFAKNTNASREMIQSTREAGRMHRDLGMGAAEASKHTTDLYTQVRTFTTLTKSQSDELRTTSMQMTNLGVSSGESAQFMSHMMDTMGENVEGVRKYRDELYNLAKEQGIAFGDMIKDYNKMRGVITMYGTRAREVFKRVQATAKSLRLEVSQLTGTFEDGFNTFDGAFEKVGRLNSIMGQYGKQLDPVSLMQMDLAERAKTVASALQNTGLAYQALSGPQAKYYQLMIAGAMGTKDTDMVVKLLRGNLGDLEDKTKDATKVWEDFMSGQLKFDAQDNVTFMQNLKMVMMQFAVAILPVLRHLASFLNTLNELTQGPMGGFVSFATGSVVVLTLLAPAIMAVVAAGYFLFGMYAKLAAIKAAKQSQDAAEVAMTPAQVAAMNARSYSLSVQTKAAAAASVANLGFAKSLMAVGFAVFLAAAGIALIGLSFGQMPPERIIATTAAIVAFGFGLYKLLPALAGLQPLVPGMVAFSFGLLLIGGAVGLAAFGMSKLFDSLVKIQPENLVATAGALTMIALALLNLGSWGMLFGVFASSPLSKISEFLNDIKTNKLGVEALQGLAAILERIGSVNMTMADSSFKAVKKFMEDIGNISPDVIVKVKAVADAMPRFPTDMSTPGAGGSPVETAVNLAETQIRELTGKIDKLLNGIEKLANRNVVLKIDAHGERVLATVVKRVNDTSASRGSGSVITGVS